MSEIQSECFKKTNLVKFSEKRQFFTLFLPYTDDMIFSFSKRKQVNKQIQICWQLLKNMWKEGLVFRQWSVK